VHLHQFSVPLPIRDYRPAPMVPKGAWTAGLLVASLVLVPGRASAQPAPEGGTADWVQVSAGDSHTCGIRSSHRLYCWGADFSGQLGDGGTTSSGQLTPTEVFGGATDWAAVDAGGDTTCARKTTGRLYCWGRDEQGEVGDGGANNGPHPAPTEVAGGFTDWTAFSAGKFHTCARRATGRLYCWGYDGYGEVGDGGANTNRFAPAQVSGGFTNWTAVSAGGHHTCARKSTGRLYCWGRDADGQVGDGSANNGAHPVPTEVAGGATNWQAVAAGGFHTCARRASGRLYCWGLNSSGQLGTGNLVPRPDPREVVGQFTDWMGLTAGFRHTCARRSDGRVWCWGDDDFGQVGNGAPFSDRLIPNPVTGGATDWANPEAGHGHSCARKTNRTLWCWGYDSGGQLGDGLPIANQPAPVQVA
jgi:alpha-tubulin suppressor-like RCC1 family protein